MTNIKILQGMIIFALMDGIASQCWHFESSFDGWLNNGWQHAPNYVPETEDIFNYKPPKDAYVWLQEQVDPPRAGSLQSPTISIHAGDIVSATFYRHMVIMDGTDRINMTFFTETYNKLILSSENYDVWDTVSITCSSADIHCCSVYPCTGYFVIDGSVVNQNDLVAFNYVGINCISPSTIPTSPRTTAPTTERTTDTVTTATPTTTSVAPSTTSAAPSTTSIAPSPTSVAPSTTGIAPSTTSVAPSTTSVAPSTTSAAPSTTSAAPSTTSAAPSTTSVAPSTTSVAPSTTSVASSTLIPYPEAYCCTFNYDTCGWSIEQVSNGWHWSVSKQPNLIPPFSTEYIWLEDASAGVSSSSINDVVSGTTFSLTYYFATSSHRTNNSLVLFGDVELDNLVANEGIQTFRYTCGDECCGEMTSCSGQFTVEMFNEPGESLSISIDEFHVDDVTCI